MAGCLIMCPGTICSGENTWEAAESAMQKLACSLTLQKAGRKASEIRYLFGGDLLRQGTATSQGVRRI